MEGVFRVEVYAPNLVVVKFSNDFAQTLSKIVQLVRRDAQCRNNCPSVPVSAVLLHAKTRTSREYENCKDSRIVGCDEQERAKAGETHHCAVPGHGLGWEDGGMSV